MSPDFKIGLHVAQKCLPSVYTDTNYSNQEYQRSHELKSESVSESKDYSFLSCSTKLRILFRLFVYASHRNIKQMFKKGSPNFFAKALSSSVHFKRRLDLSLSYKLQNSK